MYLGDFPTGAMIDFKWSTNAQDGASITRSTNGTLRIYKDNSTTERSSLAGVTQTEDFASTTGVHHVRINLIDDTDAGFYTAGHEYQVVMAGMVIDTKTVNAVIASFSIERAGGVLALMTSRLVGTIAAGTHTPQSGDTFARVGAPAGASISADIATRATPAQVNAEVVDALATDTYAEPGQGTPAATLSLAAKVNYLFKAWRNRHTQTASQFNIYGDDASTIHHKAAFSDDGTTVDRAEMVTGP